ncbi:MAG: hypothetical protein RIE59_00425 [Imperialibacter sp.]
MTKVQQCSFLAIGHTYTSFRWAGMTLLWKRRMWLLYNKSIHNDVISIRQPAERNPPDMALDSNARSETMQAMASHQSYGMWR